MNQERLWNDAYCHIGIPRFGAPEKAAEYILEQLTIRSKRLKEETL